MALLELTCPLDSEHHIQEARSRKQNKTELLSEFDRLQIPNYYETVEISVLGHYLPSSIHALKSFIDFTQPSIATKSNIRQTLDRAALHAHNEFFWLGTAVSGLFKFVTTNHFFCFLYVCMFVSFVLVVTLPCSHRSFTTI